MVQTPGLRYLEAVSVVKTTKWIMIVMLPVDFPSGSMAHFVTSSSAIETLTLLSAVEDGQHMRDRGGFNTHRRVLHLPAKNETKQSRTVTRMCINLFGMQNSQVQHFQVPSTSSEETTTWTLEHSYITTLQPEDVV